MTEQAFPPRVWVYFNNKNNMRICHCVKDKNFIPPRTSKANEGYDFISCIEHNAIVAELKAENERLKWQLKQFKVFGTDGCRACEEGRITLFYANSECITCNPKSYDSYETQMEYK